MISLNKIERLLIAMMGLLCSCGTVIAIGIGDTRLAIVNFVYIIYILYGCLIYILYGGLKGRKTLTKIKKSQLIILSFFIYICLISFITYLLDTNELTRRSFTLSLKISVVCIGVSTTWRNSKHREESLSVFLHYFYINAIIQMMWSWLERISYSFWGFRLNDFVFGQILGIKSGHMLTFVEYGRIRPSGLSWEPANLALVLVIGYAISKKTYLKLLFAISLLLTTSSTGLVMLGMIFLYELYKLFQAKKIKTSQIIAGIGIIVVGGISLIYVENKTGLVSFYFDKISFVLGRSDDSDLNALTHMMYYDIYLQLIPKLGLTKLLFGNGTFMAGQVISLAGFFAYRTGRYWNPETDVITLLLGSGWIGTFLYYLILTKTIKLLRRDELKKIIIAIFAAGITYLFLEATWPLLIVAILYSSDNLRN